MAAERIGISRTTVTRWLQLGRLRPSTTVDGKPVFTEEYIREKAAARRTLAGDHR